MTGPDPAGRGRGGGLLLAAVNVDGGLAALFGWMATWAPAYSGPCVLAAVCGCTAAAVWAVWDRIPDGRRPARARVQP